MTNVLLDVPVGTTLDSVADELRGAVGADGELFVDGRRISDSARAGEPPILNGAVITVGHPGTTGALRGALQLRVESGPDAGTVCFLDPGRHRIGRAAGAEIRVDDPDVSRSHACIEVGWDGATVRDANSTNGTFLDGAAVGANPVPLPIGARLRVGSSTLAMTAPTSFPAPLRADGLGRLEFNRPPRIRPAHQPVEVQLPDRPAVRERLRFPVIAIVMPLIAALLMVLFTRQPTFLLFGLLSPLMLGAQWFAERTSGAKAAKHAQAEYATKLAVAEEDARVAVTHETQALHDSRPSAAELMSVVCLPMVRLWERRPEDDDFLLLRLGTGTRPASMRLRTTAEIGGRTPTVPLLQDVPIAVNLAEVGVLGIAGNRGPVLGLARFIVGQLAALHSPHYLRLVLLSAHDIETAATAWDWIQWLPHVTPSRQQCTALLGLTDDQVAARVFELDARLSTRPSVAGPDTRTVVILDGARRLRTRPGVARLLMQGSDAGVFALCLEDDPAALPAECRARAVIARSATSELCVDIAGEDPIEETVPDAVSEQWARRVAHRLAPLHDVTPHDERDGLPDVVRWLDLRAGEPNAAPPSSANIADSWSRAQRSTTAVLGMCSAGLFTVDISRDGPHILVAGTTGSGKSELLQTLVCALAVNNRPDALSFVLVDYKGGAAFAECVRLPHTVGMVTDLDEHLAQRALASLTAELRRREQLFAQTGTTDIQQYQTAAAAANCRLPRLVIVIDEFASLVEELPEFVRGLADVAMRGRSLGIHLVLATQRPAGAVTADIRANIGLSIALRLADVADSVDVVGANNAAEIRSGTPGRAYARRGAEPLIAFQTAWVGHRAVSHQLASVTTLPFATLGDRPKPRRLVEEARASDLMLIVAATRAAASNLAIPPVQSPWLPPLPTHITIDDLPPSTSSGFRFPYALADIPSRQTQRSVALDLEHGSHLIVAGAPRSGRSTILRAIAAAVARQTSANDVHVYGIDCGGGALLPLADLPHCGAIATADQVDRVNRLLNRLHAELRRRYGVLASSGFADVTEQRRNTKAMDRLPYVLVLLDRWEGFLTTLDEIDGGRLTDTLLTLLREGPAVGLRVVLTADRSGLVGRITSLIEDKVILRLADRTDVALAGLSPSQVPAYPPPGRGWQAGTGIELQVALPPGDESSSGQRCRGATATVPPYGQLPFRVEELPGAVRYEAVIRPPSAGRLWLAAGIGGDDCITCGVDLAVDGPAFIVSGSARSGRSTTLVSMTLSLLQGDCRVLLVTPRASSLQDVARSSGVVAHLSHRDNPAAFSTVTHDIDRGLVVVVDDAELLLDSPLGAQLETFLRSARDRDCALVLAGDTGELMRTFRGFVAEARKSKVGLLLRPESPLDGDLLGVRLPRTLVGYGPQGRGVLIVRGTVTPVQVPLTTGG